MVGDALWVHTGDMEYAFTMITESGVGRFVTVPVLVTFVILAGSAFSGLAGSLALRLEDLAKRLWFRC